jgi:hypothetical protein
MRNGNENGNRNGVDEYLIEINRIPRRGDEGDEGEDRRERGSEGGGRGKEREAGYVKYRVLEVYVDGYIV